MDRLTYDQFLEALCLYREARGESKAAKAAVLAVIRNRAADPKGRWPKTTGSVVTQPYQFSSFNKNDPNVTAWPKPSDVANWLAFCDCVDVVQVPLTADPTGGANFYHDTSIQPPYAAWLGKESSLDDLLRLKTVEIGRLRFYRL